MWQKGEHALAREKPGPFNEAELRWCWHETGMAGPVGDVRSWGDIVAKVESCIGPNFW